MHTPPALGNRLRLAIALPALVAAMGQPRLAHAQDGAPRYPTMAPIEQYLMDRQSEIALAKSAAPAAISADAQILVLGPKGYEVAVEGKNGFVCAVERAWQAPFDDPGFFNPKTRGANCYNPLAAKSVVPQIVKRQRLFSAGLSKAQVMDSLKVAVARGEFPAPEPGAMCYMMSRHAHLNNDTNVAHLMFYMPLTDSKVFGQAGMAPAVFTSQDPLVRVTTLIVPVTNWSDGAAGATDITSADHNH